jgi:hypothetical protein
MNCPVAGKSTSRKSLASGNLFSYKLSRRLCLASAKPSSLRGATSAVPSTEFTISPNRSVCRRGTGGLTRRNFFGITYDLVAYRGHPQLAAMRGPRMGNPRETDPREGNPVYNAACLRVQKGSVG